MALVAFSLRLTAVTDLSGRLLRGAAQAGRRRSRRISPPRFRIRVRVKV